TAFVELRLHRVRLPRRNAERDVIDRRRPARRSSLTTASARRVTRCSASASSSATAGTCRRVAATDDDVADLADHALVLTAFVTGRRPAKERGIEGRALLVVWALEGDVIEPHRFPVGWFERRVSGKASLGRSLTPVLPIGVGDVEREATRILH